MTLASLFQLNRPSKLKGLGCLALALMASATPALADQNWDGDHAIGDFTQSDNWYGNSQPGWGFGSGSLYLNYRNNGSQSSIYYNYGSWVSTNDVIFESTFGAGLTWNGNGNGIDFKQRLENRSSFTQTIGSMNFSGGKNGASQIELNPVNGNLVLNGNLYNDNSKPYYVYGNNGKTLTVNTALGVGGSAASVSFNIAQNSNVIFGADQTYAGGTVISAGSLQVGEGGTAGALGSGSVTNNGSLILNKSNNVVLSNAISGSGSLVQSGSNIVSIASANSYTGATTINSGTIRVTANEALGTGAAGTTVNSGGALRLNLVNYSTAEALSINGTGVGGTGALYNIGGDSTYAGPVTVASNATIGSSGGILTLTGGVVKDGTTLTIKGNGRVNINTVGISVCERQQRFGN